MCYDISFTVKLKRMSDYFPDLIYDDQIDLDFGDLDHVQGVSVFAPHPVIYINREDRKPHCRMMEWGCIEYYRKEEPDGKRRNGMLNIRAERILDDPTSYWHRIRNRRCLIPMSGIFEHREIKGWKKKVPYFIKLKGERIFFLPGLYSVTELPDQQTGELVKRWTFAHITRKANPLMAQIHNSGENGGRMPLFLPQEMAKAFLSDALAEKDYAAILNFEIPNEGLQYHTVSTIRTTKTRSDGKSKNEFWQWENLPDFKLA